MNKNLKKVISTVAALALSASSFVALAATYPDVDSSASYAQAVNELTALGVIEGKEDGNFAPDELVMRSEFAKMVIEMLGSADKALAKSAEGQNTKFSDVKGDHWAAGYITAAAQNGIINGVGDGTFAPNDNITYAQAMKMLVCAAGYEQWSVEQGGWPSGYMYYANQVGIGNGVKDVTESTTITRAQAAQMIDNTLTAEACVETGERTYNYLTGQSIPTLKQANGYGSEYQTILIKNHDTYKVKGFVVDTNKSSASVDADEVRFEVQSARRWHNTNDQISRTKDNSEQITAFIGDSGVDNYLHQYVEVMVQVNDDDEYTILSVVPTGSNTEVVKKAADFDAENSNYNGTYAKTERLYFSNGSKTEYYKLSSDVQFYVNGVEVNADTAVETYIEGNLVGDVTLIDVPTDSSSTDGSYDYVMIDVYYTGIVDSVIDGDTDEPTIYLMDAESKIASLISWNIDLDEQNVAYSFTKDGKAISVADLQQYDVISIQLDVTEDVTNSRFYDVVVSSDKVSGAASLRGTDGNGNVQYTVAGTKYLLVDDIISVLDIGSEYDLYLDAFGRVAYADESSSVVKKIAILESAYRDNAGDYRVKMFTPDGTTETYTMKDEDAFKAAYRIIYTDEAGYPNVGTKKDVQNRVAEYSQSTATGLVSIKKAEVAFTQDDQEYKDGGNPRIGSMKLSDNTVLVSYDTNEEEASLLASSFIVGQYYTAYGYNKSSADSTYRFVIVENGEGSITKDSAIAVFRTSYYGINDEEENATAIEVAEGNEIKSVFVDAAYETEYEKLGLVEGDAIVYATNSAGYITNVEKVFTGLDLTSYDTVADTTLATAEGSLINKTLFEGLTGKYDADLYYGPIINKGGSSLEVGMTGTTTGSINDIYDLDYSGETSFYVLDFNEKPGDRVKLGNSAQIAKATIPSNAYDANRVTFDWEKASNVRYALVKTVANDATYVYIILPKTTK